MNDTITLVQGLDYSTLIASASAIIALGSALIAKSNVNLTKDLVEETRRMREAQTKPCAYLYLEPRDEHKQLTDLFIENVGPGNAHNIKFNVITDFMFMEDGKEGKMYVSNASIIKNGIKYLAPHQKKKIFTTSFYEVREFNSNNYFEIQIEYKNDENGIMEDMFPLSFFEESENGITMVTDPFEKDLLKSFDTIETHVLTISKEIRELNKTLKNNKE